ncbi:MAG TPA: hypothetical protein ENI23_03145 [bacterium]|nr:hypothetical protein [bacterium]
MRILLIVFLLMLVVVCGYNKETNPSEGEEMKPAEIVYLVEFFDAGERIGWIDFDVKNNKWIYDGDLDRMMKKIIDHPSAGGRLIVMEIIRQLKEGGD